MTFGRFVLANINVVVPAILSRLGTTTCQREGRSPNTKENNTQYAAAYKMFVALLRYYVKPSQYCYCASFSEGNGTLS